MLAQERSEAAALAPFGVKIRPRKSHFGLLFPLRSCKVKLWLSGLYDFALKLDF